MAQPFLLPSLPRAISGRTQEGPAPTYPACPRPLGDSVGSISGAVRISFEQRRTFILNAAIFSPRWNSSRKRPSGHGGTCPGSCREPCRKSVQKSRALAPEVPPLEIPPGGKLARFVACCLTWETKTKGSAKQKSPRRKLRSLPLRAAIRTPSRRQPCQRPLLPQRIRQTLNKPPAAQSYPNPCRGGACPCPSPVCSPLFPRAHSSRIPGHRRR